MMSEQLAYLTPLPELDHPWLRRYMHLLLKFDYALAQGSDFESKETISVKLN